MYTLNSDQIEAVTCNCKHILCLAGAGTGKSTVLLERITNLVQQGVDPSSILALTFTNAAAFEMKNRYLKGHSSYRVPEFRTFHSFCYHILATNSEIRRSLGYVSTPTIADESTAKRIKKEAQTITGIRSSIESLEKKKSRNLSEQRDYDLLKKSASKLMRSNNTITFDDLCYKICNLFAENSEIVSQYKDRYKYIFVDEFQDTDPIQYKFVSSFSDSSIFVVGDALQSLYSFRGADSSIIKRLSTDSSWATIKLHENYRSTRSICDFANENSEYADDSYRVIMNPFNKADCESVICVPYFSSNSRFINDVDKDCSDYCVADINSVEGSSAVLFRTNREVKAFQDYCNKIGLKYRSGKKSDDIRNILYSVGDNEYLMNWLATFLNSEQYSTYVRLSAIYEGTDRPYTITSFRSDFENLPAINERLSIVKYIRILCKDASTSMEDKFRCILEIIGCNSNTFDSSRCSNVRDMLQYIVELYENNVEDAGSDIYVGTVHSVKGLEFDNVYVFGVDGPTFRLNNEDNLNVYYVAITRAKKHLVVFKHEGVEV